MGSFSRRYLDRKPIARFDARDTLVIAGCDMATTDFISDTVILATDSGTLAIGLTALLLSIPPIQEVERVADINSLLSDLETIHPLLIILDTSLSGPRTVELLDVIGDLTPNSLRVLLSNNMAEYRELIFTSRDTVVIHGTEPNRLARTLESLLKDNLIA